MGEVRKPWDIDMTVYEAEEDLLAALKRRDPYACTCFMKWYAPRMTRLAVRMMGDPDEADGVVQDSFISACNKIDTFRGESSLATWLHRIVMNTSLMRLRGRKVRVSLDDDQSSGLLDSLMQNAEEPLDDVIATELGDTLNREIARLPETLRTVLVLREFEGLSTRETAEMLGISESAVKVRLHRGRQALQEALVTYATGEAPSQSPEQAG